MRVVVIGGGICGLGTALLLARDGHEVTLLERDADPAPAAPARAWDGWTRSGVAQFHQPHNFMPGLRRLLERELPDVQEQLQAAGATRFDLLNPMPPVIADRTPRPIDESLWTWTARRPVGECVFASTAEREPRITMRRGARVAGLLTGPGPVAATPHVTGVRMADDEELRADLVIDAMGRQSRSTEWLQQVGAKPPREEQADCGFMYYTRYFSGTLPVRRAPGLMPLGTISMLTLPGDNGTWSVTIFGAAGDQPLKALRHADTWEAVVRACPLHAHWLEGEPTTGVLAMGGIVDRRRNFHANGGPVVTGFVAVADAWACTNPSAGRGLTVGFLHGLLLRDVLRDTTDGRTFIEEYWRRTEAEIAPWFDAQIAVDRARFADMEALREGRQPSPPADDLARAIGQLFALMPMDADLFRAALEYIGTLTPVQSILRRPEIGERMRAAGEAMKDVPRPPLPAPTRQQLVEILA